MAKYVVKTNIKGIDYYLFDCVAGNSIHWRWSTSIDFAKKFRRADDVHAMRVIRQAQVYFETYADKLPPHDFEVMQNIQLCEIVKSKKL